jgi:hypothetical protein
MATELAGLNPHPRDARIKFIKLENESRGFYYVDGKKWTESGVTRLLKIFFPDTFDKVAVYGNDTARMERDQAENYRKTCKGSFMSVCHDDWINGRPFKPDPMFPEYKKLDDIPEWKVLLKLMDTLPKSWVPYRSEWPLFSTKLQMTGVPDYVMRDMAYPNETRLIIIDFKCQVKPFDMPFCNGFLKNLARRTACKTSKLALPESHVDGCPAVGSRAMRNQIAYKYIKCGAQMAIYRMLLLSRYEFPQKLVIDRMVAVFIEANYPGVKHFHQQDIDQFEEMLDQLVEERLKQKE